MNATETAVTSTEPQAGGVILHPARGKVIAITSGKGGVGKTFLSANLAAALTRRGLRVLVLDADLGLANLDVVLNLYPKLTLHDVFTGKCTLQEAIVAAPGGFSVLLAGSGMVEYSRLTPEVRDEFLRLMAEVVPRYDVVLLDTGAGISDVVLFALSLASEVLLVATPEPTSLTDAYATIKVLATQQQRDRIRLVVNQAARPGDGRVITQQLQTVLNRFVSPGQGAGVRLLHMGDIPVDPAVKEAVMRRQLLLVHTPGCPAALAVGQIAGRLVDTVLRAHTQA
ncbi:Flagellum site-determining protein YlxH [Tepidimonas alkaliphilus]|uniref:Flagellum site-determining protein YlxH n=1 Tax=Tepidimonas alkaliphilus TaxID=2588942 RepID=A0A554WBU9_9BURK|nr:MinD/ParA family protein [Tepidimonas alkaliphilus]TSE21062.1 Flagellum site-determining protein YlxH [Tepidimonas alkaliphilus]